MYITVLYTRTLTPSHNHFSGHSDPKTKMSVEYSEKKITSTLKSVIATTCEKGNNLSPETIPFRGCFVALAFALRHGCSEFQAAFAIVLSNPGYKSR